jgi:hypothetical protein
MHSSTRHYMEVSSQLHSRAALSPGREPPLEHIDRKLGGPQIQSGGGGEGRNSQILLGIEPRSSNPQPSHCLGSPTPETLCRVY